MKFPNTSQLKEWLERDHPELAMKTEFEVDDAAFRHFRKQLHAQGDHKDPKGNRQKEAEALDQVALFATLTWQPAQKHPEAVTETTQRLVTCIPEPPTVLVPELRSLRTWLRIIAIILFLL